MKTKKKPASTRDDEFVAEARRIIPKIQRAARGLKPRMGCTKHKRQGYFEPGCEACERALVNNMDRMVQFLERIRGIA